MQPKNGKTHSLVGQIHDDLKFLAGAGWLKQIIVFLGRPQFRVLFWYRLAHYFWRKKWPLGYHFAVLRMSKFGCYIHPHALLGRRVKLAHPVGIVMGQDVVVEDDCVIYQNVTLGGNGKVPEYPTIQKGAVIYAGATILGGCTIGEGAVVGANSVVLKDIPAKAVAKGNPAKF